MKFETGDIVFVKGDGFLSTLIKDITNSDYSHVAIVYDDDFVFETHWKENAGFNPISVYKDKKYDVFRPKWHDIQKDMIKSLCEHYNHAPYGKWDIITNLAFSWLPRKKRIKVIEFLGRKSRMVCSELVGRIMYDCDPDGWYLCEDFEGLRPDDLAWYCFKRTPKGGEWFYGSRES